MSPMPDVEDFSFQEPISGDNLLLEDLQNVLGSFIANLQQLLANPPLVDNVVFLGHIALDLGGLSRVLMRVSQAKDSERFQTTGEIVHNILTQSLTVVGVREREISLATATTSFDPHNPLSSDLHKILLNFLQFSEETLIMVHELQFLLEDLLEE